MKIIPLGDKTGVYLLQNFLTVNECATLIRTAKARGMEGGTFNLTKKGKPEDDISKFIRFKSDATPTIKKINKKIHDLTGFPEENGEPFRVVQYGPGGQFSPHNDYKPYDKDNFGSGRVAQMLFYLNDVNHGGETYFTELEMKIVPQRGNALLWYGVQDMYLPEKGAKIRIPKNQKNNPYALHVPIPITQGEKWIATKFLHDRDISEKVKTLVTR